MYLSSSTSTINKRPALDTSKMASVVSVPANESIQNDQEENVNLNRGGRAVTLAITVNNTQNNDQEQSHTDCEDIYSIEGKFSFKIFKGYHIPFIIRVINGVKLQFVSVRMVETELLSKFLHSLHANMYSCTSVRSYFITDREAKLLNNINKIHCNFHFGNAIFFAKKDCIVLLEDAEELYTFLDLCYKALLINNDTGLREKCGYILVNFKSVLPYSIKDGKKYIPLFCFETENLQFPTVQLENWNLAYLKFCCKVQGIINNEFLSNDSCTVISLDDIKNYYSTDTHFVEYWPLKIMDKPLLKKQNSTHINPPGVWIKAPLEVVIPENSTIFHTLTESAPVLSTSMSVMVNYEIRRLTNQMGSTMSQGSSLIIDAGNVVPIPPLFESVNTTTVNGNSVSYSNVVPSSQCMTTVYNPMTNSNMMSHSNQMQQLYSQNAIYNTQAQQQQIQQQQHQQQQINTTPQTGLSDSSQSVYGHLINTQLHNATRNVEPIVATPITESSDLTSEPWNPMLPNVQNTSQDTSLHPDIKCPLTRIPERILKKSTNTAAYKVKITLHPLALSPPYKHITWQVIVNTIIRGKMIHSINANPYIYTDLLITLQDLVRLILPSLTVTRCVEFLRKHSKMKLYGGNSEQLALLCENGLINSIDPEATPMVMLLDIRDWLNTAL